MNEKNQLLEEKKEGLDLKTLQFVFLVIAIALAFFIPKIYIASNIYYTSLEIAKEKDKLLVLENENRKLRQKIELIRFNNDTAEDYLD